MYGTTSPRFSRHWPRPRLHSKCGELPGGTLHESRFAHSGTPAEGLDQSGSGLGGGTDSHRLPDSDRLKMAENVSEMKGLNYESK